MFLRLAVLIIILCLPACADLKESRKITSIDTQTRNTSAAINTTPHIVQKGETLWRISKIYHIDLDDILKANQIPDSASINAGQTIFIPRPSTRRSAALKTNINNPTDSDFIWPAKGKIISLFKQKSDGVLNKGIDIETTLQEDIIACRQGKVIFIGELAGYGKTIIIDHQDGFSSVYCGSSMVNVRVGEEIEQGRVVAKAGTMPRKGYSSLHFEIRKKYTPQNPLYYLSSN